MARETDFLDLYRLLDLQPGCGLDEFKHAYRRRVAVLHPDRRSDDPHGVAAQRLQQLTAMYGMAMEFHRTHGRLPGAAGVRPSPSPTGEAGPAAVTPRVRKTRQRSR
ncbi:MAG: J domain-containing protein, partial [Rhodanobacter sp.]